MHRPHAEILYRMAVLVSLPLIALLSAAGCGGGSEDGDGGGGGPPVAVSRPVIQFPPGKCVTPRTAIVVRGAIEDPAGVTGVDANGVAATSTDGFATWQAPLVLAPGNNTVVATRLPEGTDPATDTVSILVEGPAFSLAADTAFDASRQVMYHIHPSDDPATPGILETNVATGERQIVSLGLSFVTRAGISASTGTLYVLREQRVSGVLRRSMRAVGPATGWVPLRVFDHNDGQGPDLVGDTPVLRVVVNDATQQAFILIAEGQVRIMAVGLATGDRAYVATLPAGGIYTDFVVNDAGDTAYVMDRTRDGALHVVDLSTGAVTDEYTLDNTEASHLAIGTASGGGPIFYFADDRGLYVYDPATRMTTSMMARTDPDVTAWVGRSDQTRKLPLFVDATNNRLIGSTEDIPELVAFDVSAARARRLFPVLRVGSADAPGAVDVGIWGADKLVYTGLKHEGLFVHDLENASHDLVLDAASPIANASLLGVPLQLAMDGDQVLFVNGSSPTKDLQLFDFSLTTNALRLIGPDLDEALALHDAAVDPDDNLLLATDRGIVGMSRGNGAVRDVLAEAPAHMPPFVAIHRIQRRAGSGSAYALSQESVSNPESALFGIDLAAPTVHAVTTASSAMSWSTGFSALHVGELGVYVANEGEINRIDASSGARTPTSGPNPGAASVWRPSGMSGSTTGVLFVADVSWKGIVAVDTHTGAEVLVSR